MPTACTKADKKREYSFNTPIGAKKYRLVLKIKTPKITLKIKKRYTHTLVSVLYCSFAKREKLSSDFSLFMDV